MGGKKKKTRNGRVVVKASTVQTRLEKKKEARRGKGPD